MYLKHAYSTLLVPKTHLNVGWGLEKEDVMSEGGGAKNESEGEEVGTEGVSQEDKLQDEDQEEGEGDQENKEEDAEKPDEKAEKQDAAKEGTGEEVDQEAAEEGTAEQKVQKLKYTLCSKEGLQSLFRPKPITKVVRNRSRGQLLVESVIE